MNKLIKFDRFMAWVLFGGMLLYFISGYGMTKGIISADFATKIHLDYLTYIILVAFITHTYYAIHCAFKRWRIWNIFTKIALFIFFLAFALSFVFIDIFFEKEKVAPSINENLTQTTDDINKKDSTDTKERTFTLEELAKYNGKNGMPAYVAVDGLIYDMSTVFKNGFHYSHFAGEELTNAFYVKHAKSALSKYPPIGKLVD